MKIFFKRPIYERFCFVFTLLLMPVFSTFPQQYLDQQEQPINGNSYWRVTRSITQNEISRSVFAEQAASEWVRVLNWNNSLDFAVRLTVDPVWDRIIFSE
ncbi:MAG: hypothetical protein GWN62_12750, partial [Aliifodinibius sp.]|nr:hypothetical protein [Fodinibius sp.]